MTIFGKAFIPGGRLGFTASTSSGPKPEEKVAASQPRASTIASAQPAMAATVSQPFKFAAVTEKPQAVISKPGAVSATTVGTTVSAVRPEVVSALKPGMVSISPLQIQPLIPIPTISRTTTQLTRVAIDQLEKAQATTIKEALNAIRSRNVPAAGLINYLERKVKIGEVLNEFANRWSDETKQDFSQAFTMESSKLEVMDSIVSIAILNDADLEEELRAENMPETTAADLIENRRIVWQHPEPGTPLEPPYLILVAVEHQDVAQAEEVIQSILGKLVSYDHSGYKVKLPKSAVEKLRK
jgi:hypothetical protein